MAFWSTLTDDGLRHRGRFHLLTLGLIISLALIINLASPSNGEEPWESLATIDLESRTQDVAFEGDLALVAQGRSGITTLDLSDPGSPVVLGSLDTADDARDVALSGQLGLVADNRGGLVVLDLTRPNAPSSYANLTFQAPVVGVALQSSYGYVMTSHDGLQVVDLSEPEDPEVVANLTLPGPALDIYLQGHLGLVAMGEEGAALVDLTNPLSPSICSTWSDDNHTYEVFFYRDYGYLAQGSAGLQVLDLSQTKSPIAVDRLSSEDEILDVEGAGNYLYLADNRDGLGLARTDDPAHPRWLAHLDTNGYGLGLAAKKDTVLLADGPNGLKVARALPTATILEISPDPLVFGDPVDLEGTGLGFTLITSYRWSSDLQGHLGSLPWINLNNLSLGVHQITLEVADASGHWSKPANYELIVTARPQASIETVSSSLLQEGETFEAHGSGNDDGFLVAYQWIMEGVGIVSESYQCILEDLTPGTYQLHLRVQDDAGVWSTPDTLELSVNGRPIARILKVSTPVPGGLLPTGEQLTLEGAATDDGDPEQLKFNWISDLQGPLGSGAILSLGSMEKGQHEISLVINDGLGGTSRPVTTGIVVADRPQAVILSEIPDILVTGNPLELSGQGLPAGEVVGYRWESDKAGELSTLPQFLLDQLPPGGQNLSLTVISKTGIPSHPVTHWVNVNHQPTAQILSVSANPAFSGSPFELHGAGSDPDGSVVAHQWQLSTGPELGTSPDLNLSLDPGRYLVEYQVQDDLGSWSEVETLELKVLSPIENETLHVAPGPASFEDGSATFPLTDLQNALDLADEGWTIVIHGGSHTGPFTIEKGLSLKGLGMPELTVDGTQTILQVQATGVLLDGLSFSGSTDQTGILLQGENHRLVNLTFTGLEIGLSTTGKVPVEASQLTFTANLLGWTAQDPQGSLVARHLSFVENQVGWQISGAASAELTIRESNFENNLAWAMDSDSPVDARYNWWGQASGPREAQRNPTGTGDNVTLLVDYRDWLTRGDFLTIKVLGFKAVPLSSGAIKFLWQTDQKVIADLVVLQDDESTVYPSDGVPKQQHEIVVHDLDQGKEYDLMVTGRDDGGAPFNKEVGAHYVPVLGRAQAPLTVPPVGLGLLAMIGLLCGTLLMRSWNEPESPNGMDPEGEGWSELLEVPEEMVEGLTVDVEHTGKEAPPQLPVEVEVVETPSDGPDNHSAATEALATETESTHLNESPTVKEASIIDSTILTLIDKNHEEQKGSSKDQAPMADSGVSRHALDAEAISSTISTLLPETEKDATKLPRWVEPTVDPSTGVSPYQPHRPAKANLAQKLKDRTRRKKHSSTPTSEKEAPSQDSMEALMTGLIPQAQGSTKLLDRLLTAPSPNARPVAKKTVQETLSVEATPLAPSPEVTIIRKEEPKPTMEDMKGVLEEVETLGLHFSDWMNIDPLALLEEESSLALELKRYQDDPTLETGEGAEHASQ